MNFSKISYLLLFLGCACFAQTKHVGIWNCTDQIGDKMNLKLTSDNFFTMYDDVNSIGGVDFKIDENIRAYSKYTIDYTQKPIRLDMSIYDKSNNELKGTMHGLAEFTTDNQLKYLINFDVEAPKPTSFDDSSDSISIMNCEKAK
jgi:hypothetical protein